MAISPMSCIIQSNKVFEKATNLGLFDGKVRVSVISSKFNWT